MLRYRKLSDRFGNNRTVIITNLGISRNKRNNSDLGIHSEHFHNRCLGIPKEAIPDF